jgi:hypothetical protein
VHALPTIEIINNTRGGIEGEIWERGNWGQIEIPDEHHTILGLHLKPEKFKNWVFYMFCMSSLQTFPQTFEFKRVLKRSKLLTSALFWSALKNVLQIKLR